MATQLTDEELFSTLDAEQNYQTLTEAAQSLGLTRKGFAYRLDVARNRLGDVPIMARQLKASAQQSCRRMSCPRMS